MGDLKSRIDMTRLFCKLQANKVQHVRIACFLKMRFLDTSMYQNINIVDEKNGNRQFKRMKSERRLSKISVCIFLLLSQYNL